jgi:hypothetical protein
MTTIIPPHPSEERPPIVSTAVTLAALAILAGFGVWRATHSATALPQDSLAEAGMTPPVRAVPSLLARPEIVVYLVGSAEERASVQASVKLAEAAGIPEVSLAWLVVDVSAPEGAWLAQVIARDANVVRPDGRPAVTLVNLRAP